LVGLCVHTSIEETGLSRFAASDPEVKAAQWRCVSTFSPLAHTSPTHRYGGAINHVKQIEETWNVFSVTPHAKQKMARDVLSLWQSDDGDNLVGRYLNELESALWPAIKAKREEIMIDIQDLPTIEFVAGRWYVKRPTREGR
jgi:hypothetical protein